MTALIDLIVEACAFLSARQMPDTAQMSRRVVAILGEQVTRSLGADMTPGTVIGT